MRVLAILALFVGSFFATYAASPPTRVFTLHKNGSQSEHDYRAEAQRLRAFIWLHWTQHSPGEALEKWSSIEGEPGTTIYKIVGRTSQDRHIVMSTTASSYSEKNIIVTSVERGKHALFLKDATGKVVREI